MSAVRFTRICCAECGAVAPSLVVAERRRLVAHLTAAGWSLTLGEALCPRCARDAAADVPSVAVGGAA